MLDHATQKRLYNFCNPDEPVASTDTRYVFLDEQTKDGRVRGEDWSRKLVNTIALADQPSMQLFTGLRGSGKSTVLKRVAHLLQSSQEEPLFPVVVRAEELIDIGAQIDVADVLVAVVYAACQEVSKLFGEKPEHWWDEGPIKRVKDFFTRSDVVSGKLELGTLAKLPVEMKTRSPVRLQVRAIVNDHVTTFHREVQQVLEQLTAKVKTRAFGGIVIIVDSLEKLQGTSSSWVDVLDSAERLFANGAPYLKLPVHTIYTVPPALAQRLRVNVQFLPMMKLLDRNGAVVSGGIAKARELLRHRISDEELAQLFGTEFEARVRELILGSAGYPRELMYLLQNAIGSLDAPFESAEKLASLLTRLGQPYREVVTGQGAIDAVARIAVSRQLILNDDERKLAARLISENIILRYANDSDWYDIHPAVRAMPEVQTAIDRLQTQSPRGEPHDQ